MTPERAQLFLSDLHKSGWSIGIGPFYAVATHATWGAAMGRGDTVPDMLDDLRRQLKARELCE